MTFAQALACQRDDLADSVVDLKIRISQIEKERHALHEAQSVDAVTIQALKESCEVMKSKLEQQEAADALEALEEWHLNASGCIAKVNELEATNKALQSSLVDAENRQNERWLHEYAQQDNAFEAGGEMY